MSLAGVLGLDLEGWLVLGADNSSEGGRRSPRVLLRVGEPSADPSNLL